MYNFLQKFVALGLMLGDQSTRLNSYLTTTLLIEHAGFFIFCYQQVTIKLYKFLFLLNNLALTNKRITLSSLQPTRKTNVLNVMKHCLPNNRVLTTWYPGLFSNNEEQQSRPYLENFVFLPSQNPATLVNFGRLPSDSVYTEINYLQSVFLLTVNSSTTVNNWSYSLPMNTDGVKRLFFIYSFLKTIFEKSQRLTSLYKYNSFINAKYRFYKNCFQKKKRLYFFFTAQLKLLPLYGQNKPMKKRLLKRLSSIIKKKKKLTRRTRRSLTLFNLFFQKYKRSLKRKKKLQKNIFYKGYFQYYYNSKVTPRFHYYKFASPKEVLALKTLYLQAERLQFFSKLKSYEYTKAKRLSKKKHQNPKFYIIYRFYKYLKDKKKHAYIGFIRKYRVTKTKRTSIGKIFTSQPWKNRWRTKIIQRRLPHKWQKFKGQNRKSNFNHQQNAQHKWQKFKGQNRKSNFNHQQNAQHKWQKFKGQNRKSNFNHQQNAVK